MIAFFMPTSLKPKSRQDFFSPLFITRCSLLIAFFSLLVARHSLLFFFTPASLKPQSRKDDPFFSLITHCSLLFFCCSLLIAFSFLCALAPLREICQGARFKGCLLTGYIQPIISSTTSDISGGED